MPILSTAQSYLFIWWDCQQLLKLFHRDDEACRHSFLFKLRVDPTQLPQNLNTSFCNNGTFRPALNWAGSQLTLEFLFLSYFWGDTEKIQPFNRQDYFTRLIMGQSRSPKIKMVDRRWEIIILLTSNVQSLQENIRPRPCRIELNTARSGFEVNKQFITCMFFCYVIVFALRENNALQLANQSTRYIAATKPGHIMNCFNCFCSPWIVISIKPTKLKDLFGSVYPPAFLRIMHENNDLILNLTEGKQLIAYRFSALR